MLEVCETLFAVQETESRDCFLSALHCDIQLSNAGDFNAQVA